MFLVYFKLSNLDGKKKLYTPFPKSLENAHGK